MLTPEQRQDYERAAVALEAHATKLSRLEEKAWSVAARSMGRPITTEWNAIDTEAARLLRECIEKGEVLK